MPLFCITVQHNKTVTEVSLKEDEEGAATKPETVVLSNLQPLSFETFHRFPENPHSSTHPKEWLGLL